MSDKIKRDLEATRNALLNSTAKLMTDCSEPSEVTSRAIAKESGVNLAMINYCFGSREGLLYEVFRKLLSDVQKHDTEFIKIMSSGMSFNAVSYSAENYRNRKRREDKETYLGTAAA